MQLAPIDTTVEDDLRDKYVDTIEKERLHISQRGIKKGFNRNIHHHRVEHELYLKDLEDKSTYNNVQTNLEKEERYAIELQKQKKEEIVDIKTRQQLRETSLELRELEAKLRAAYVQKELSAQIAEKEYAKIRKKIEDDQKNEILRNSLVSDIEALKTEAQEDFTRKMEYKKDLQDQMIWKYQVQQSKYEEFLKEKKMLDDIIQRMHDEDERELVDKMCKMKKTQMEIDEFKEVQKIWREKERVELEEESRRIEEFLKSKEKEARRKEKEKLEKQASKDIRSENLTKKLYIEQMQRKERDEILEDLMYEEVREKENQRIKEEFQRQVNRRIEMQNTLARQLQEQHDRLKQDEMEDNAYKQQMWAKKMEDDKIEQMTAEKRRRKMIEYRREIEETMKERRAKRAEEIRILLQIQEQEKQDEDKKRKIIDDERIKLLKEHASNLLGYMPPGVLRADDLPHLGSDIVKYYSTK